MHEEFNQRLFNDILVRHPLSLDDLPEEPSLGCDVFTFDPTIRSKTYDILKQSEESLSDTFDI